MEHVAYVFIYVLAAGLAWLLLFDVLLGEPLHVVDGYHDHNMDGVHDGDDVGTHHQQSAAHHHQTGNVYSHPAQVDTSHPHHRNQVDYSAVTPTELRQF